MNLLWIDKLPNLSHDLFSQLILSLTKSLTRHSIRPTVTMTSHAFRSSLVC